jgi:hypothetical protein
MNYDAFREHGEMLNLHVMSRIRVHFVFDVHDLRRKKSRLVAGGHMTAPPKDVCSGLYPQIPQTLYVSWGAECEC